MYPGKALGPGLFSTYFSVSVASSQDFIYLLQQNSSFTVLVKMCQCLYPALTSMWYGLLRFQPKSAVAKAWVHCWITGEHEPPF